MAVTDRAARALDLKLTLVRNWSVARPPKGWVRAIRDALGMTSKQLAQRLGVTQPRVVALEKGEIEGTITLASLRKAAAALDCELVYAFVPNEPLGDRLRAQAKLKADRQLGLVSHSMRLENQSVSGGTYRRQRDDLVDQYLRGNLHRLWDETP